MNYHDEIAAKVIEMGGDVYNDDDVMDAIVELDMDVAHYTDEELQFMLIVFRLAQYAKPLTKKRF